MKFVLFIFVLVLLRTLQATELVVPAGLESKGCSSLDGPYCMFVNHKPIPKRFTTRNELPTLNSLEKILQRALEQHLFHAQAGPSLKTKKKEVGAFSVQGVASPTDNTLVLFPQQWIVEPSKGWVTVGFVGGFEMVDKKMQLNLTLTGPHTKTCSQLFAKKIQRGFSTSWFDGVFVGSYTCAGRLTNARLVLVPDEALDQVRGRFSFVSFPPVANAPLMRKVRDRTLSGCVCQKHWSYAGKEFHDGRCAKVEETDKQPWCFFEPGSCEREPASSNWDWCSEASTSTTATTDDIVAVFHFNENGEIVAGL